MPKTPDIPAAPRNESSRSEIWARFLLNVCLLVVMAVLAVFVGVFIRNKTLIEKEILARARSHFENIVLMRRWNAQYGGVFVEKTAGVVSNPYLENPDITAQDGRVYTKKNPALMTREVSELAAKAGMFAFHITSLKPLNPNNVPDRFEADALRRFEAGEREVRTREAEGDDTHFRYMAPLFVEKSCLACHGKQGYAEGQVRGGISVRFDITEATRSLARTNLVIVVLAVLLAGILVGLIYLFVLRLMRRLNEAMRRIQDMAVTDELTGLYNRRHLFVRLREEHPRAVRYNTPLACIMADIDFFKEINDCHGHQSGDAVLRGVAEILKSTSRQSDVTGRYGGEEFLVVLPGTTLEGARSAAEKIRMQVEAHAFASVAGETVPVTLSLGCAAFEPGREAEPPDVDRLLSRADQCLYRAKSGGRNRVETWEGGPEASPS
ncbi:MAG: diguanylate cyclase [Thermodesulfobacteriota bacterium]